MHERGDVVFNALDGGVGGIAQPLHARHRLLRMLQVEIRHGAMELLIGIGCALRGRHGLLELERRLRASGRASVRGPCGLGIRKPGVHPADASGYLHEPLALPCEVRRRGDLCCPMPSERRTSDRLDGFPEGIDSREFDQGLQARHGLDERTVSGQPGECQRDANRCSKTLGHVPRAFDHARLAAAEHRTERAKSLDVFIQLRIADTRLADEVADCVGGGLNLRMDRRRVRAVPHRRRRRCVRCLEVRPIHLRQRELSDRLGVRKRILLLWHYFSGDPSKLPSA